MRKPPDPALADDAAIDWVIVPGCPSLDDGRLSRCQWSRAMWATLVWEDGRARGFITSGSAVQNRYTEAVALKAGMVALGVPEEVIVTETQALHTDENAGFGLKIAQELGYETLGVASHGGQARGMRALLRGWGHAAIALPMDMGRVRARLEAGHPEVRIEPVPADGWMTLRQRERAIRKARGKTFRRPPSLLVYAWGAIAGNFTRREPPEPLEREPTLPPRSALQPAASETNVR